MTRGIGKSFPVWAAGLLICVSVALAHTNINGTWVLQPTRSNFAGEQVLETGTVTISDREHHIYISRTFNYDSANGGFDYNFTTDGNENSSIKNGKSFKSKAKWEGGVLKVKTTRDGLVTTEQFSLTNDGLLMLMVERPNHQAETLLFQRQ